MDNRPEDRGGTSDPTGNARRTAIKSLFAGTATASAVVLGGSWVTPRVTGVVLPAHATTTATATTTDAFNGPYTIVPSFDDEDFDQADPGDCDGDDVPSILAAIDGQPIPLTISGSQASVIVSSLAPPFDVNLSGPGSVAPNGQFSFVLTGSASFDGEDCETVSVTISGVIGAPGGLIQGTISNVTTNCGGCITSGSGTFTGQGGN